MVASEGYLVWQDMVERCALLNNERLLSEDDPHASTRLKGAIEALVDMYDISERTIYVMEEYKDAKRERERLATDARDYGRALQWGSPFREPG